MDNARSAKARARSTKLFARYARVRGSPKFLETFGSPTPRTQSFSGLAVDESLGVLDQFQFSIRNDAKKKLLADAPIIEAERRLRFLIEVGLGYLALDRPAQSLSSGEIQRLRLAAQLGSGLTGALYVLDEPTIGLHARDTERLIENLRSLVKTGSTVLVVEHDADVIANADYLIDLGPAGGREGGAVVASGPPSEVLKNPDSPTGKAFSQPPPANALGQLKLISTPAIVLEGAQGHNLKGVHFSVQTERLTVVVGVSGSGKSTLVSKVFFPAVRKALGLNPMIHCRLASFMECPRSSVQSWSTPHPSAEHRALFPPLFWAFLTIFGSFSPNQRRPSRGLQRIEVLV